MPHPWTGLRARQTRYTLRRSCAEPPVRKRAESVQKVYRIFWLRSLTCKLQSGVLAALKMSGTTPGSQGKIPQARRRRARRRVHRKWQQPTPSTGTVGYSEQWLHVYRTGPSNEKSYLQSKKRNRPFKRIPLLALATQGAHSGPPTVLHLHTPARGSITAVHVRTNVTDDKLCASSTQHIISELSPLIHP